MRDAMHISQPCGIHAILIFYPAELCCLQSMTWEDREKVLRMLFASLRGQRQEPIQAPAPKPSYESDNDEVDNPCPLRGIINMAGPAQLA